MHTPVFPVKKMRDCGQPTEWFVKDLQAVNAAVQPRVPKPSTILSQVTQDAKFFSVVPVVPVDPDNQFWFAEAALVPGRVKVTVKVLPFTTVTSSRVWTRWS